MRLEWVIDPGGVIVRTIEGKVSIVRRVLLWALVVTGPIGFVAVAKKTTSAPNATSKLKAARVTVPNAAATPVPAAAPANEMASGVTPIGSPGEWFPIESYPPEARAASQEGRTHFSLDIDAAGRITGCNILESSGSDLLDSTTCSQLILNGRFKPAMDRSGKPMRGTWKSAMRWQLADAEPAKE